MSTVPSPYRFCYYCGNSTNTASRTSDGIKCSHCNQTMWLNSVAVAVLIIPHFFVTNQKLGVYIQKRGIEPAYGEWALPSGYVMQGESWEAAACREAAEEIDVICRHDVAGERPTHLLTESGSQNDKVVVVGVAGGAFHIGEFSPNEEVLARSVIFPDDERQLCWPIHRKALAMFWELRGLSHNVCV